MAGKRSKETGLRLLTLTLVVPFFVYQSWSFWRMETDPQADPTASRVQFYIWFASAIVAAVWWTIFLMKVVRERSEAD